MEFEDMARDPRCGHQPDQPDANLQLLAQRRPTATWEPEGHALHEDVSSVPTPVSARKLATTAYIAWAVFANGKASDKATQGRRSTYSPGAQPGRHQEPARPGGSVCNATLVVLDPQGNETGPYLDRLAGLRKSEDNGKFVWWEQAAGARTVFYWQGERERPAARDDGAGSLWRRSAGQASLGGRRVGRLAWLVSKKDAHGTWHSTQATVLALRALLAGTGAATGRRRGKTICGARRRTRREEISLPADQAEVMKVLDVSRNTSRSAATRSS